MRRFKVRRKGSEGPVFSAYAPDRYMEIQVTNGVFSANPGDYVIETAPSRILIVPARFFGRAWEEVGTDREPRRPAPKVESPDEVFQNPEPEEIEQSDDEDRERVLVPAGSDDEKLWALTTRELESVAAGYQIKTGRHRSKKQWIDAIKAAERG